MVNLRQLLATSRSLIGVRAAPPPLKMVEQDYLPRFGTLAARLDGTSGARATSPDAVSPPAPTEPLPEGPEQELRVDTRTGPKADPAPDNPAECPPQSGQETPSPKPRGTRPATGPSRFGFFSRRQPRAARQEPCQLEMALGRVRVMRNDLRDADLELVEPRRRDPAEQVGSGWRRLAAALVPAGTTSGAPTNGPKQDAAPAAGLLGARRQAT